MMSFADIPKLFTALAEWGSCFIYLFILPAKGTRKRQGIVAAFFLAVLIPYHMASSLFPGWAWIPYMIGAAAVMCLYLYACLSITMQDAVFCGSRAFLLAEFCASLHWQLYVWLSPMVGRDLSVNLVSTVSMAILYAAVMVLYCLAEKRHFPSDAPLSVNTKEMISCLITAAGAFLMSNISFVSSGLPFTASSYNTLYVRTLLDAGGLLLLYTQQDRREDLRIRGEYIAMNAILDRQYEEYRTSLDNMDQLKREFHDLKHYMIAIRAEKDPEKKEAYLSDLENAIEVHEAMSRTGNSVLDVILTSKNLYCLQHDITLTALCEAAPMDFLHVKDICSIFGNILDNAIESVAVSDNPEKRIINLTVRQKNDFLFIQCENCSDRPLVLGKDGLPATTKKDTLVHGYGLKSIRAAAQKYSGQMTLSQNNGWFVLKVLIPIPHSALQS